MQNQTAPTGEQTATELTKAIIKRTIANPLNAMQPNTEPVLQNDVIMWECDDAKDLLERATGTLRPMGFMPEHLVYRDGVLMCPAGTPMHIYKAIYVYTLGWGDRDSLNAIPGAPDPFRN